MQLNELYRDAFKKHAQQCFVSPALEDAAAERALDQRDGSFGRDIAIVKKRVELDQLDRGHLPGVRAVLQQLVGFPEADSPWHERARAGNDFGVATVDIETHVEPGGTGGDGLDRSPGHFGHTELVDIAHREGLDPRIVNDRALFVVDRTNTDERDVLGFHCWLQPSDSGKLRVAEPQKVGEWHAMDIAGRRSLGQVHVAMRVEPQQADVVVVASVVG